MVKRIFILIAALFWAYHSAMAYCNNGGKETLANHPWQSLYKSQKDTLNWTSTRKRAFPNDGWLIKDNELILLSGKDGGDILTKREYADFELTLEFKMSKLVNSGVKYFVNRMKNSEKGKAELVGFEYQIIDDFHQDEIPGFTDAKGSTGAIYLLQAPKSNKHLNPLGEWNSLKIRVDKGKVTHWLNGKKIVSVNTETEAFKNQIRQSKFKYFENFGNKKSGFILLQDHGSEIHYRNIMIKE